MILPKGQAVHENLNTSYTNFDQLLNELRANRFTGYMNLTGWKYDGVIFMDSGNLANVVEETEGKRRTGLAALEGVRSRAKDKDGTISVYRLSGELVALMAGSAQRAALYEKLSTDLTSFDRLISNLRREKHTGHVEIEMPGKSSGMIFMQDGATIALFYSANGATAMGSEAMAKLEEASRGGAVFGVYRSDATASLGQDFVSLELVETWQNLLALVEGMVDRATAPGVFATALRRGCLENVDAFPFLDPFADAFEFKDGQIRFGGKANNAQFSASLARSLASAANTLDDKGMRALRDAMRTAAQTQREQLETWGITSALPQFFS